MHLFCFGLGYVSQIIAKQLGSEWKISGSHTGKRECKSNEYIFNEQTKFDKNILNDVTHILISIPPNDNGDPAFLSFIEHIKQLPKLKWIGYFSTSSVYGDHQGQWVIELSETKENQLGSKRLIAEKQWLGSNLPVNILRLSAIYGPHRSSIERIKAKMVTNIFKKGHYFSRIHVQDLSQMTQLIMNDSTPGEIYNIADDNPCPQHEVTEFACNLLKIDPPELIDFKNANLSELMQQYYSANKRVDNRKIKNKYNYKLSFPTYREGLLDCFKYTQK